MTRGKSKPPSGLKTASGRWSGCSMEGHVLLEVGRLVRVEVLVERQLDVGDGTPVPLDLGVAGGGLDLDGQALTQERVLEELGCTLRGQDVVAGLAHGPLGVLAPETLARLGLPCRACRVERGVRPAGADLVVAEVALDGVDDLLHSCAMSVVPSRSASSASRIPAMRVRFQCTAPRSFSGMVDSGPGPASSRESASAFLVAR